MVSKRPSTRLGPKKGWDGLGWTPQKEEQGTQRGKESDSLNSSRSPWGARGGRPHRQDDQVLFNPKPTNQTWRPKPSRSGKSHGPPKALRFACKKAGESGTPEVMCGGAVLPRTEAVPLPIPPSGIPLSGPFQLLFQMGEWHSGKCQRATRSSQQALSPRNSLSDSRTALGRAPLEAPC